MGRRRRYRLPYFARFASYVGWPVVVLVHALLLACGAGQRPVDAGPRGTLRIDGEPETAIVEVDEKRLGPVGMFADKGLLLKPGQHRVIVRAEGYFPAYELVDVAEDEVTVLEVTLRPVPE